MKRMTSMVVLSVFALCAASAFAQANQVATFQVQGLTPANEMQIENTLRSVPGVAQVKASSVVGAVVVVYDPAKAQSEALLNAVSAAGFLAKMADEKFQCPQCSAKYAEMGDCIVCSVPLEPIQKS